MRSCAFCHHNPPSPCQPSVTPRSPSSRQLAPPLYLSQTSQTIRNAFMCERRGKRDIA
ncbi:hypothetical protein CKAH01_09086 [Colletotrichum kahawae]|uniref:Uncharacterized protein n=1 Tax=Colletotrichum kahawae TaxID=34407 RepID=A0AAD9Y117_COLKA|nr:hypothetical protein CKAH01_09086 [Colletotrichum kahawae]